MLRALDVTTSIGSSVLRLGAGRKVGAVGKRPETPLELYEFEACPYCRKVREALSILDLDILIYPCPKGGARSPNQRPKLHPCACHSAESGLESTQTVGRSCWWLPRSLPTEASAKRLFRSVGEVSLAKISTSALRGRRSFRSDGASPFLPVLGGMCLSPTPWMVSGSKREFSRSR